ncbi:MAG: hypothetical protein DKINENOH_01093 [bacterium]|nr:hypothetical protein [bacterium]
MQEFTSFGAPLVSIIIPTYNYGHFIAQTLDSVLEQTFQDWECLIVDDGSTDETFQVVKRCLDKDKRFRYHAHQSNQGLSAARNTGLKESKGKYIQILDADDVLEKRKIEIHATYLENHPEVDIVYGNVRYFRTENTGEKLFGRWRNSGEAPWMPETSGKGYSVLETLVRRNIMVVNAPLFRKSVFDDVGIFDEELYSRSDWDYWIRCAEKGKYFQYLEMPQTLALVRWHIASMSNEESGQKERILKSELLMRAKMMSRFSDSALIRINRERIIKCTGDLGIEEIMHGNMISGSFHLIKAGVIGRKLKYFVYPFLGMILPREHFKSAIGISLRRTVKFAALSSLE